MLKKVKNQIVNILAKIEYISNEQFGNKDYEKFVVITRSRTGSNFLIASLDSHPRIIAYREIFRELNGKSCSAIWDKTFSNKPKRVGLVGFKIFYYHPLDSNDRSVWDKLYEDRTIKIIHLKRENLLRTVLSGKIALKTNVWTKKKPNSQVDLGDKRMRLDVEECIQEFNKIRAWESEIDETFSNHNKLNIYYESLVSNPEILQQVLDFLGASHHELKSKYKKQNKEPLKELIENYDEFSNKLKDTEWEYLLQEEG